MKKIGYMRATLKKEMEEQSELLISAGCSKLFVEPKENSDYKSKAKLFQMINTLANKDTLAVTRLSIIVDSVQTLLELMSTLEKKQIVLEVVEQNFITSDIHTLSELLLYLSEFIDDINSEKQAYGVEEAKKSGKRFGRPPKLTEEKMLKAIELKQNHTSRYVANGLGVGRSTLLRHIAKRKKGV